VEVFFRNNYRKNDVEIIALTRKAEEQEEERERKTPLEWLTIIACGDG